ncbi:MAG: c-type cytochrome [Acidobacteria bacterium]|nr:c-type cytochrome [Acidobacteriota bacterium]
MKNITRTLRLTALVSTMALTVSAQRGRPPAPAPRGLPDEPGKETVIRLCGSTCHGPQIVSGKGYSKDNWAAVVNGMISRGAKANAAEFTEIVDYLGKHLPPRTGTAGAGGVGFIGAGPDDAHIVDAAAADRGKSTYVAECVTCHGPKARGGPDSLPPAQRGADLVRSLVVLKDRYGATIGAFLKKGHPMQSGKASARLDGAQVIDLAHFLHAKVGETLRSGPYSQPINVLTGNKAAGEAYFKGAGGCTHCHSISGDLAGIGKKYDPVMLQQKFLFPRTFGFARGGGARAAAPKQVTLKVTPPDGKTVSGTLAYLDDFNVALRDSEGEYHSWKRTPALKVEKNDPYQGHIDLLDKYTDKDIHNVVAFLNSVQ